MDWLFLGDGPRAAGNLGLLSFRTKRPGAFGVTVLEGRREDDFRASVEREVVLRAQLRAVDRHRLELCGVGPSVRGHGDFSCERAALLVKRQLEIARAGAVPGSGPRAGVLIGARLSRGLLVDVLLPFRELRLQSEDDVSVLRGEVVAFARIVAEIEKQVLAAVDEHLPAAGSHGLLLPLGT